MTSTSRSEADAMIEEFIRLQEDQVRLQEAQVRIQEAQLTVLKRMLGSSPAAATSTPSKNADGDPEKEPLPVTGDSMRSGQDGMAVLPVVPMEEAGEIIQEESGAGKISTKANYYVAIVGEDSLQGMHLRKWCGQDPHEWWRALCEEDCKSLMDQLREDPSLMMVTVDGRTVLHVASIYGYTPLVHQVLQNSRWHLGMWVGFYDADAAGVQAVYYAVDARTQLMAADINTFFVGQKYSTRPSSADGHYGQLVEQVRADINQLLLVDETNHEVLNLFREDEIYGCYPEHIEFTFHQACRQLLINDDQRYMRYPKKIIECLSKGGGEKLNCLLQLQDPRGNPPLQHEEAREAVHLKGLDHMISTFKELLQSSPNSFGIFINASDTRGWTYLHKCAARGYHHHVERLMKEESIDGNLALPKSFKIQNPKSCQSLLLKLEVLHPLPLYGN